MVHDYFSTFAGAERVTKQILQLYPDADVFTLFDAMEDGRGFLDDRRVMESPLARLPAIRRYYRLLFPLFPWAVERLDVSDYDIVVSSSHSAAKGVRTSDHQVHICYCHSPARWAWDLKEQYLQESGLAGTMRGRMTSALIERFRRWDQASAARVDHFVANSAYIKRRIRHAYDREATVIYPPVDIDGFPLQQDKGDAFVVASRFVWYKRIPTVVQAFNDMPDRRLVVVGGGPQEAMLRRLAGPNVEVRGRVSAVELRRTLADARALVTAAEEDFGITTVEAQACGTPVIAYGQGGALETVVDGETGTLFPRQTASAVRAAVEAFERCEFDARAIRKHAETFAPARFDRSFRTFVQDHWARSGIQASRMSND